MPKITLIGAGSTIFAKSLVGDILSYPELSTSTISLFDIDSDRLQTSLTIAQRIADALDAHPIIEATTDRRKALEGADYAICMIQVAGYYPGTVIDFAIPKRYGLQQTIGDTLGIGGIMRGLRTIPVLLEMCRDMEEVCPNVMLLNYVNPMAINCWAISRGSKIKTVGLCHSVQNTANWLARDIRVPSSEINYVCAGINHMAFYLRFERNGEDLYPCIRQVVTDGRVPPWNRVRYDVLTRLGYFVTESSEHFSEYVPWYIKSHRPDLIKHYNIPLDEYPRRCEMQAAEWEVMRTALKDNDSEGLLQYERHLMETQLQSVAKKDGSYADELRDIWGKEQQSQKIRRSGEYAPQIIHAMESNQPYIFNGNVTNHNLISNLGAECCVEVPCLVDKNGVQPMHVGLLPPQIAALIQTNINVQALTVEAALTGKRQHIYHAAMLDPHTASELDLNQIWSMVDDLIVAHGEWLPQYE